MGVSSPVVLLALTSARFGRISSQYSDGTLRSPEAKDPVTFVMPRARLSVRDTSTRLQLPTSLPHGMGT